MLKANEIQILEELQLQNAISYFEECVIPADRFFHITGCPDAERFALETRSAMLGMFGHSDVDIEAMLQ